MSTHERVIRGILADALDDGRIYDQQVDGIIAYVESVAGQTIPRPDTEQHKPNSLADSKPAEQPERREHWRVWQPTGGLFNTYREEENAREAAQTINGTYCLLREVLPGDPSPEVIADVVRQLRGHCDYLRRNEFGSTAIQIDALADTLEGKQ